MKYHIPCLLFSFFLPCCMRKRLKGVFFAKHWKTFNRIGILALFCLPFLVLTPIHAVNFKTLYFYNSDTNINNFASLKIEFDTYLSKLGNYHIQPFNRQKNFEDNIELNDIGIFMLSSWHYQSLKKKYPLKSVLIGEFNGKSTQKRVLSTKKQIQNFAQLKGKKIASAGSKEYTRTILKQILGNKEENIIDSIKIQLVPKDIDALLAVGFGMADAALTTENSFNVFKEINHKQFLRLSNIGQSKELYLPVIATLGKEEGKDHDLLDFLAKMNSAPEGESKLRMLGLDRLRTLNHMENKELNDE